MPVGLYFNIHEFDGTSFITKRKATVFGAVWQILVWQIKHRILHLFSLKEGFILV